MSEQAEMMTPVQQAEFLGRVKRFEEEWSGICEIHSAYRFPGAICPLCRSDEARALMEWDE